MIVAILGTNAASSNLPSNGVSYGKNNQTTVEGALNDLYTKANYGNATASQILKGQTALVGGKKVTGTMPDRRYTGNMTGGLNVSYPNIALNVGANTQLTTGTDGVNYIATSPPQGWYEGGGSSYAVIPTAEVANLYGITGDKLIQGTTIAGVNGTIPVRGGSSQATQVGSNDTYTYFTFPYGYYPAETHFNQTNSSEVYAANSEIASAIGLTANKIVKGQTVLGITGTGTTGYSSCSSCCPSCPSGTLYKYVWFNKTGTSTLNYSSANGAKELTFSIDLGNSYSNVQLAYAIVSLENSTFYFEIYDGRSSNDFVAFSDRNWTNEMGRLINETLNPNSTSVSVSGSTLTVKVARSGGIYFRKYGGSFSSNETITYRIKGAIYYQV
jgi:hypothetical protein